MASWRPSSQPDWPRTAVTAENDPLGILRSTAAVIRTADDVAIDMDAITAVANDLRHREAAPEWDAALHYRATGPDGDERTAMWILVLDTLNFCFWGQGTDPSFRWRVAWRGELVDGYIALVATLTRAVENGVPLDDASFLADVDDHTVEAILAPAEGHALIPLFHHRVWNLRELGNGLLDLDSDTPATTLIRRANGSAIALIEDVVRRFPSFHDVATWPHDDTGLPGNEVRFYKRAQILAGDLAGGLQGSPLGTFHDLDRLTAFADYKVPQVLRELGILRYSPALAAIIEARDHTPAGSLVEMEIRAGTIWGVELLRQALRDRGRTLSAYELDWLLWTQAQALPGLTHPYHLTPTVYY